MDAVDAASSAIGMPPPSIVDQKTAVVARIKLQRRRLQTRSALKVAEERHAQAQAAVERAERVTTGVPPSSFDPVGILSGLLSAKNQWTLSRIADFVRHNPIAAAGIAGVAFAIGPGRVFRWATLLAPFLLKSRR